MSLTQTLMNGGMIGCSINPARYNHDNGALRIATESVEELHDIFMTTFYATEQAELGAVHEGVALEESSYAAVYEGAVRDAFTKVKEFLKKLWDKVKAWFHSVKRFLDSLFMSGKEFVKKYAADIRKANNIKDFEFKMFDYNNELIDSADKSLEPDKYAEEIYNKGIEAAKDDNGPGGYKAYEAFKKECEHDNLVKKYGTEILKNKIQVQDGEEFNDACYAIFRSKKNEKQLNKDDKEEIEVTNISDYATILEGTGNLRSSVDYMIKKTDKAYSNAIKKVNDFEKETRTTKFDDISAAEKDKYKDGKVKDANGNDTDVDKYDTARYESDTKNASKVLNQLASAMSTIQGLENTYLNAWKTVVKERDSVYKQLIIAGLANHRKNSKSK